MNQEYSDSIKMKLTFLWNVYISISDSIRFSDMKAGAVITVQALIWGLLLSNAIDINSVILTPKSNMFVIFIGIAVASISVGSMLMALLSIYPSLKIGNKNSLIYFAHIVKNTIKHKNVSHENEDLKNYISRILNMSGIDEVKEVAEEVWACSIIALNKYKLVSWSIRMLFICISMLLILIIFS